MYANARVALVPMRFGSGIKIKAVEALQHGVPIVTTSSGAPGLGVEQTVELAPVDDPIVFAERLVDLTTDDAAGIAPAKRSTTSSSGRTARDHRPGPRCSRTSEKGDHVSARAQSPELDLSDTNAAATLAVLLVPERRRVLVCGAAPGVVRALEERGSTVVTLDTQSPSTELVVDTMSAQGIDIVLLLGVLERSASRSTYSGASATGSNLRDVW